MTETITYLPLLGPNTTLLPALPYFEGVVYWYTNIDDDAPLEYGKKYVGCTTAEAKRVSVWNCSSSDYAGPKIAAARKTTPPDKWEYISIPVVDVDKLRLIARLLSMEAELIERFDSYENGYNGNRGGAGKPRTTIIRITTPSGEIRYFRGYQEVAEEFGLTTGGVQKATYLKN